jgi:hypothetical protein
MGTKNERELRRIAPMVGRVNELEPRMKALRTEEMPRLTAEWKEQVQKGRRLEEVLPEAFALVREASMRTLGMRHFDVQLIGGNVLHEGKIAEMKTGEGKTLVATLPLYLNALTGRGTHLVTVNDYLARRDARWMAPIWATTGRMRFNSRSFLVPTMRVRMELIMLEEGPLAGAVEGKNTNPYRGLPPRGPDPLGLGATPRGGARRTAYPKLRYSSMMYSIGLRAWSFTQTS